MTIMEAIRKVDGLKHNTYTSAEKIAWLSRLDSMVKRLVIDTHEGWEKVPFAPYTEATPEDTELLVKEPWDEMYLRWLEGQIDYHDRELDGYNAAMALFNTVWETFQNDYNRSHMPLSRGNRFRF